MKKKTPALGQAFIAEYMRQFKIFGILGAVLVSVLFLAAGIPGQARDDNKDAHDKSFSFLMY